MGQNCGPNPVSSKMSDEESDFNKRLQSTVAAWGSSLARVELKESLGSDICPLGISELCGDILSVLTDDGTQELR
jgi:hypothetical protein